MFDITQLMTCEWKNDQFLWESQLFTQRKEEKVSFLLRRRVKTLPLALGSWGLFVFFSIVLYVVQILNK